MTAIRGTVAAFLYTSMAIPALYMCPSTVTAADDVTVAQETELLEFQDRGVLEEILVTARKREEKLQDVPISITAFGAKQIRDRNINDAYDIAAFTPNFQLTPNLGRRLDNPNIRGQFGPAIGGTAPNASFFIDGVYVAGSIGSTSVANLERVEILRGPQSATFGRATFAGAVNYITRKPGDVFEGQVNVQFGENGREELGAWASGPLVKDKLFFFVGASNIQWDGEWRNGLEPYDVVAGYSAAGYVEAPTGLGVPYGQNFALGKNPWFANPQLPGDPACIPDEAGGGPGCAYTVGDNTELGGEKTTIGTAKLTWAATDDLEFNIKYEHTEAKDDHFVYLFVPPDTENNCYNRTIGGPAFIPGTGVAIDPNAGTRSGGWYCGELTDNGYVSKLNIPNMLRGSTVQAPGTAAPATSAPAPFLGMEETIGRFYVDTIYDINDYEITARYAHNDGTSEYVRDLDRSYSLGPAGVGLFEAYSRNEDTDDSVEVRLDSPGDQRIRWGIGYYWYNYTQDQVQRNFNGFGTSYLEHPTGSQEITNTAVFGSIEVDLTDDWTFAFEGRYANDDVSRITAPFDAAGISQPPNCTLGGASLAETEMACQETFYSFSPRVTLSWNVKDDGSMTAYGQIAEGNKPGGFNLAYFDGDADFSRINAEDTIIQEETATTYELGLKGVYFDGTLSANLAVFYIDWKNQSVNLVRCIPDNNVGIDCQDNNVVENAGKSSVTGLELETSWFPTDFQTYTLAFGITDTELEEFIDDEFAILQCPNECYETLPNSAALTPEAQALRDSLGDVAGNSAPTVPKYNAALSQVFRAPLASELEWFLRNDVLYESKRYYAVSNLTWAPEQWTWNARLGLEKPQWTLALYVNNVTNEKSPIQIQDFPLFDISKSYQAPQVNGNPFGPIVNPNAFQLIPRQSRNAGITAQYRFGAR